MKVLLKTWMLPLLNIRLFALGLLIISCTTNEDTCEEYPCLFRSGVPSSFTGYNENLDDTPQDIYVSDVSPDGLPSSVSLESWFPPVGAQGDFGTCVAWAVGYNLKTALNAIEKNWSYSDLLKTENQTSPKDLWFAIDNSRKSSNCVGTSFEPALDALMSKGAANLSLVPYINLGICSGSALGNANNKIASYSKIAYNNKLLGGALSSGMELDNFKGYLAQNKPILIGAKVGDSFVRWSGSRVLNKDTYNEPDMQHAYHALVLVGYDDSKKAFRLRNAWGQFWGDNGSIWIDYDFFLKSFASAAFVAENL